MLGDGSGLGSENLSGNGVYGKNELRVLRILGLKFKREKVFEKHTIPMQEGVNYYIFSDGFQDQFGGAEGRKYMSKQFRELLQDNAHLSMTAQQEKLEEGFKRWKGSTPQTDDVLVMGIKC